MFYTLDEAKSALGKSEEEIKAYAREGRLRELRKQRDHTFNQIKVALARLGDRDQLPQLEKLPFNERIVTLDRYLASLPKLRAPNSEERT